MTLRGGTRRWVAWLFAAGLLAALVGAVVFLLFPSWFESTRTRAGKIVGAPLPASATDVRVLSKHNFFAGDDWVSAAMSRDDFERLMKSGGQSPRADLVDYWPSAFRGPAGESWWSPPARPPPGEGYFLGQGGILYAATYSGGRMYFRRSVN